MADIPEMGPDFHQNEKECDRSPPADDDMRLSKHDEGSSSGTISSDGEVNLPSDDVPELFSDEDEPDTTEMQNVAFRTM